jgi:hypothetical protein
MHLHVLVNGLSREEFELLAEKLPIIRTTGTDDPGPTVGGLGVVRYEDVEEHRPWAEISAVYDWLGVRDD